MFANGGLSVAKILAGILFYSQTILADGLHSISDLITDLVVLAGLKVSERPADEDHRYGHRRVSTLVAMFVGAALVIAASWIVFKAIISLHEPAQSVRGMVPFWVAVASVPVKEFLFQVTRYVGRRTSNVALLANAWHHRTDAFTSIAAAVGLAGVAFGGADWCFLDPLTAIVLAAFLLVVAVKIIAMSSSELIDRCPDAETMAGITDAVSRTPGVLSYHAVRARKTGGKVCMDIHIQVDPNQTVKQGHDIATAVRENVMAAESDVVEAIVHIEPPRDVSE